MLRSAPLPTPLMSTSSLESVEEADARMWRDKAFARFKSEAEAVLLHFERAQEWADLIADLLKLQRVLNKYPQFNVVPDKVLVAKRLYQCLNSALPAGVHLKTLETFELIFSRIGVERLARDLAFYSEGIFPLYRYAAFQVKPVLLDLFERHYVPLGPRVVPCLPGLVPALLLAMDDVGADRLSQRALSLLDALASCTPIAAFMAAVWGCLLHNSAVRLQALHYITTRFPTPGADADDGSGGLGETSKGVATTSSARLAVPPELFCPDAEGTVLRSLVVALQRGDSLVRRTALELLVNHFPLPAPGAPRPPRTPPLLPPPVATTATTRPPTPPPPPPRPSLTPPVSRRSNPASPRRTCSSAAAAVQSLARRATRPPPPPPPRRRRRRPSRSLAPRDRRRCWRRHFSFFLNASGRSPGGSCSGCSGRRRRRPAPRRSCRCRRTRAASSSPPLAA